MEDELTSKGRQSNSNDQNETVFSFVNNFWGEKLAGYDVLDQNLRNLQGTVKELELYFRDSANNEDVYVKQLNKTTTQMQKFSSETSFSPIWFDVIKDLNEQNSWSHLHFMNRIHELIKEVQSYYNDLRKKKRKFRQNETKTSQLVEQFRGLKQQLQKSKDLYHQMCGEVEKQKQTIEINQQQSVPNQGVIANLSSALTRLEKKCQNSLEEYNQAIEKYNAFKVEFEQRYADSCTLFQMYEETHLGQMRTFLFAYTTILAQLNSARQKNFNECQQKLNNVFTVDALIQQFLMDKGTGQDRPTDAEFIEFQNSMNSTIYEGMPSSNYNKRRSLTTPVNDPILNNTLSSTTNLKKINESKGFSSIFNIRSKKTKKASDIRNEDGSENSLSFSPNSLKLSSTTPDTLSKEFETQNVTHEVKDLESGENHFVKNENNHLSQNGVDLTRDQLKKTAKKRLNSLPSFETNAKSGNEAQPSSFDNNNFFDVSFNNKTKFIDEILNDNEFETDFFPAFSDENVDGTIQSKKDNDDMNNFYESSGSFDEDRKNIEKKNPNDARTPFPDTNFNDSDDDSDFSDDSEEQKKIFVKINPITRTNLVASPDILNQVSKSLKLNLSENPKQNKAKMINLNSNELNALEKRSLSPPLSLDENNHESITNTKEPPTATTTATTTQAISVSVFQGNSATSKAPTPPPLPPLPLVVKQKFQEQQKRFQQEFLINTDQNETIQKSGPILINTNGNSTIKIIKKNLEISYVSSRPLIKTTNESSKGITTTTTTATTAKSNGPNIRVNIRIPADNEMQF